MVGPWPLTDLKSLRKGLPCLSHNNELLNSWKEIAAYLKSSVRTVQRWEKELYLPVRRPHSKIRSPVMALRRELDEWTARAPLRPRETKDRGQQDVSVVGVKVLVVEDSVKDLNTCVSVLHAIGVSQLDVISNVPAALLRLKEMARGKFPKPNVIILDLAHSLDSGLEMLRYWRSNPALKSISVVVWTAMRHTEKQLGTMFGVHRVVPKWAGAVELEQAVMAAVATA